MQSLKGVGKFIYIYVRACISIEIHRDTRTRTQVNILIFRHFAIFKIMCNFEPEMYAEKVRSKQAKTFGTNS